MYKRQYLNGAIICDEALEKVIYMEGLDDSAKQLAREVMEAYPHLGIEVFLLDHSYVCRMCEVTRQHFVNLDIPYTLCGLDEIPEPTQEWGKINFTGEHDEVLAALEQYRGKDGTFDLGLDELSAVTKLLGAFGVPEENFAVDLTIARGLDYYTGTVYETTLLDHPEIGSVCSGGRYDNLAGYYTDRTLPGVGISIGVTRLFYVLQEQDMLSKDILTAPAEAVVIPMDTDCMAFAVETATALRAEGVKTQIYFENRKFKQKIGFADKSGIPFALIIGGDEAAAQASEEYFVIKQYKGFKSTSGSPETEASVIASCNVRLAPFAVSAVREFFSEDELELEMIGQEPTAFFLVMSDTDKTFNFILAMLLYQLFDVNTAIADKNPGSHCKIPVNCILDELANIGRIPDLDVKIATLRSRWIYITAILQSVTQLKKMYKDNADIIEGNCDTTLFLGRCDLETNKKISERLGKFTATVRNRSESHGRQGSWSESENKIGKELMAAADLGNNPEKFGGDDCIVFVKNAFPFLDKKYRTIDHPRYHELREVGEFNLDDWNWDRKCERDRVHRAEVEEMRWRIEEARAFFDPEFFM